MRADLKRVTVLCFCATLALAISSAPAIAQTDQTAAAPSGQNAPAASDQAQTPAPAPGATAPAPVNPPMTGPQILISTSMGDITVQLDATRAPKSVANVLSYVREKHYDGTAVYRVAKGFVIQMGSFDATGGGRPVHPDGVSLEAGNGLSNVRGAVALAHGDDPNSATAEFFIDLADNSALDSSPGFAVFGQVIAGMDVVDKISQVPVGDNGPMPGQAPVDPIVINKVSIIGEPG